MEVYYDAEHKACAVKFDKDDTVFIYQGDNGIEMHSCKGGKPKMLKRQLLFSLDEQLVSNKGV